MLRLVKNEAVADESNDHSERTKGNENVTQFRIVVLDCPIDHWELPYARDFFTKVIGLKLRGYGGEYPRGVISIDTSDFVGTHIMICRPEGGSYVPVLAYRSISLAQATLFQLSFPPLAVARAAFASKHVKAIENLIDRHVGHPELVRYCSAYTIEPELRKDREFIRNLKEVFTGIHVNFHLSQGTRESMLAGVVRFKTDQMFKSWGYQPLEAEGLQTLPPIPFFSLKGEHALLFNLPAFSAEALRAAERYRSLWDARLEVRDDESARKALEQAQALPLRKAA